MRLWMHQLVLVLHHVERLRDSFLLQVVKIILHQLFRLLVIGQHDALWLLDDLKVVVGRAKKAGQSASVCYVPHGGFPSVEVTMILL